MSLHSFSDLFLHRLFKAMKIFTGLICRASKLKIDFMYYHVFYSGNRLFFCQNATQSVAKIMAPSAPNSWQI